MTIHHYNCRTQDIRALGRCQQAQQEIELGILAAVRSEDYNQARTLRATLLRADKHMAIAQLLVGENTGVDWLPLKPSTPRYDTRGNETAKGREAWERYEHEYEQAIRQERERTEHGVQERIKLARLAFGDELVDDVLALGADTTREDVPA